VFGRDRPALPTAGAPNPGTGPSDSQRPMTLLHRGLRCDHLICRIFSPDLKGGRCPVRAEGVEIQSVRILPAAMITSRRQGASRPSPSGLGLSGRAHLPRRHEGETRAPYAPVGRVGCGGKDAYEDPDPGGPMSTPYKTCWRPALHHTTRKRVSVLRPPCRSARTGLQGHGNQFVG